MKLNVVIAAISLVGCVTMASGHAESLADAMFSDESTNYLIQPGDILQVSVWRETDLQGDIVVTPDGHIAMPLIGQIDTAGKTVEKLRGEIIARIQHFVPDADVTVSVKQPLGNKIYVIGKVNRPGEYVLNRSVDVMQALSMAAGMAKFADEGNVKVLRRSGESQQVIPFDYTQVEAGRRLEQNIVLKPGDVVVVP